MSGEILEDYFRRLNLVETRRKYVENIKEVKQVDKAIEEYLKVGISITCRIAQDISLSVV
jgi:hypothetical protein